VCGKGDSERKGWLVIRLGRIMVCVERWVIVRESRFGCSICVETV